MKHIKLLFLLFAISPTLLAQIYNSGQSKTWAAMPPETINEYGYQSAPLKTIQNYDFSTVWQADDHFIIGFIGANFQRLDIRYSSIIKDHANPTLYYVYGKSKVKTNICDFQGTIKLIQHYKQTKNMHEGYKSEGYIIANIDFYEKNDQQHSGQFKGVLETFYAIDSNGKLVYPDDGDQPSSNYNNGFVGTWTDYQTKKSKPAHWGADFVPLSSDLNVATAIGDFIPNEKYQKNGWQHQANGWVFPTPENWWK